jgi:hypothetical protein
MQGVLVSNTICHSLTGELTSSLFHYFHVLNDIDVETDSQFVTYEFDNLRFRPWIVIGNSDLQISSLALHHLSYSGSIDGTV